MRIITKYLLIAVLISTASYCAFAQKPAVDTVKNAADTTKKADQPKKPEKPPKIKPYKEVITEKAQTKTGLLTVHKVEERYFFELGSGVMNKKILVVSRISKAGADMRSGMSGYAGDQINETVIRFEKGPEDKIFLRKISFSEYSRDSTTSMYRAVMNSNVQPIAAAFDIKAFSADSTATVIDVTDFLKGDNDILFFSSGAKSAFRVGGMQGDKSYIVSVHTYPINTEIKTVKTYGRSSGITFGAAAPAATPPVSPSGGAVTLELNSSLVLLPENLMQPRYFDSRVGYFAVGYTDFDKDPQGVERVNMIKRWRLEPKPEDMARYRRGELVEPAKPIVFYIDPATPKEWVPYLIQGVNDWQKAFEKAGFKNAIVGREAPTKEQDSTWSLEDARFSAIVYKPSSIPNASGPSVADPRTGEIMESHINWYHNVMRLLRNWYFIQAAPSDKRARQMEFSDELMGQLIRFVSSHEVGHTLGLRHNFGASGMVPVENLRNKKWVEANGHTPSIMDYARFNYVAQPEDNIGEKGLFPRIGAYDEWAIEWGYRLFPQFGSAEAERAHLNKWVIEKNKNPLLWFGTETNPNDPRSQNEDLGDNAMKASEYGIMNLKRVMDNLPEWTRQDNRDYSSLTELYKEVGNQFTRYLGHVTKNIGGIYETPKTVEQEGAVYAFVPKAMQVEAMDFLKRHVFTTPLWLSRPAINERIGITDPVSMFGGIQERTLSSLLSSTRLMKLISAEEQKGTEAYSVQDLFSDLQQEIWKELPARQEMDVYRRNLQKMYISQLESMVRPRSAPVSPVVISAGQMVRPGSVANNDIISVARGNLKRLQRDISAALPSYGDSMTALHLEDCLDRIRQILDPK